MTETTNTEKLQKNLKDCLNYSISSLLHRDDWGSINFNNAKNDLEKIFQIIGHLNTLPIEYIPESETKIISDSIQNILVTFKKIDNYTIEITNHTQERDNYISEIKNLCDQLYKHSAMWIPFLAYQKGDIAENIKQLSKSVKEGEQITADAKSIITQKQSEIEAIINTAREASAGIGAAVFSKEFENEAIICNEKAKKWLIAGALFGGITLITAVILAFIIKPYDYTAIQLIQVFSAKILIMITLLGATIWCGKIYKALCHQETINKHRGLSIKTIQAFINSAEDIAAKDTIAIEASKAIFGYVPTGMINVSDNNNDSSSHLTEIIKSYTKAT